MQWIDGWIYVCAPSNCTWFMLSTCLISASRDSHAELGPSRALRQSYTTDDILRRPADKLDKDNSEQEIRRVSNNPAEDHAEFHAKLPTNVYQPSSPTGYICKGHEGAERSTDGLPKASATSNGPHERRATAPQPLLPPTADVIPTGDRHHSSPTGFARSHGRPSRPTKAATERLSPEVSSRSESVSKSISRSLSAEVRRSLPTDVSESVSDSALGSAMCIRDGRCCGQCPKLNETPVEAGHHRQDPDEDSVQVKNLVNLQPSRNAAGLRGIHRHEPPAFGEHRDLHRSGEQPDNERTSPEPVCGARETMNAAADIAGEGRMHLAAADTAMMPIAVREANDSSQTARYSRESKLQNQHRYRHQPQDPCASSLSSVAGTAEEQGRTRALTSSVGTSGKSEQMTSRSNERPVSTSSGCRSWSDTKLPPAGHDNADAHCLRSDSVAESVECSSFGTNNVSRLVPLCDSHPSLETATYEGPGSKSASAPGPASSAGYGSGSVSASQPSRDMVPPSFQSCTSPSNSRRGGCRTTGGSQASLEPRLCSEPASAVEGSGRFEGGHRSVSPPHKSSSWSQSHPSSTRLSDGTNGCSGASAWTETTIHRHNRHARSADASSRSTSSRRTPTNLNSNDVKMTRSIDPCVCEETRRGGQRAPPPQTTTSTTVPPQSWSSQTSSRSKVHHSGSRPEVACSSNSGKSSMQNPHSAASHPRSASGEIHSAGTHSGIGSGDGNADSRTSWSAASAFDTPLSTQTQSNRSMISMPSSSRESRRAFRHESLGMNSAGTHSGVGSGNDNADSRTSWSAASASDAPLSTQAQSSRSVISMPSSSRESRRAFRQEPLGTNSAGTHSIVGSGDGNADSGTSWSAALVSDTSLSTRTQSNGSMISMPVSSRESRRAFQQEPLGTNSAGKHSGVGSCDGNVDSRMSWSAASVSDTPLSTQTQSNRSMTSMPSSSRKSHHAFRQEPLGTNSAGTHGVVGSGDGNADSKTSWSAALVSDTPLSTRTQSSRSMISMPSSSRESRRAFRQEPLGTNRAEKHSGVGSGDGSADSRTSRSAASASDTPLSTQTQSNRSVTSIPPSSRESRHAFRQEPLGTNSAGTHSSVGSGDGNADSRTSWSAASASDTPPSTRTQSNRSVILTSSSSRESHRAFREETLGMNNAGTYSGVGSGDGNADSRTSRSAASASDTPLSTQTQSNRSAISVPSSSRESRRAFRQEPLRTSSARTHSGVGNGDGNADSRTNWSAASASVTPSPMQTQSNKSVISMPSSSRESRRAFREETLGTNSAGTHSGVGSGNGNTDSRTSWSAVSASDTPPSTRTQSTRSVISMPSSSRESHRAPREEALVMYSRTDLGSSKRMVPPPPRLTSSRPSMRQSEQGEYSSTAHDSTQLTLQPGNLPRSASNTSYGKGKSVTSETRARSSKLSSCARSSTPTFSSTPTEARLPAPDETSTGCVEGGLRSQERISPPPLMNPSTASYSSEDVDGLRRNERWAGNVRAPAARHDSRSEASSKSTNMGQGGWDSGEERVVPPLQPTTLTGSGSPLSSSMWSNETRGDRATAGGARFYTATAVPALEDNQGFEGRSSGSLTHIDPQHMDVSDRSEHAPEPPSSTFTTSNNSDRRATPSNRGSNRSSRGCESLSSSPRHSVSKSTSERSSTSRNAAPAQQTLSDSHGSAASYYTTPSVYSLHRSVSNSQSRGEIRKLSRSERRGESDGTSCSLQGGGEASSSGDFRSASSFSCSAPRSTGGLPVRNIQPRRRQRSRSAAQGVEDGTRESRRGGAPHLGSPRSSHEPRLSRSPDHLVLDYPNITVWNAHPNDV